MYPERPARRGPSLGVRDALRGIWVCVRTQRNMRIHLAVCCYVVYFGLQLPLSRGEWACLIGAMGLVTGLEAANTGVETLCNFAQKHPNPMIRDVKDVAAGAVLLGAIAAAALGLVIFLRPELWQAVQELYLVPWKGILFLASLGAAWVWIALPGKQGRGK